jgi:hypothetical protein
MAPSSGPSRAESPALTRAAYEPSMKQAIVSALATADRAVEPLSANTGRR